MMVDEKFPKPTKTTWAWSKYPKQTRDWREPDPKLSMELDTNFILSILIERYRSKIAGFSHGPYKDLTASELTQIWTLHEVIADLGALKK